MKIKGQVCKYRKKTSTYFLEVKKEIFSYTVFVNQPANPINYKLGSLNALILYVEQKMGILIQ